MARSRRRPSVRTDVKRDAKTSLDRADDLSSLLSPFTPFSPLTEIEDGRSYHPDPDRGAVTIGNRWARVVVHPRPIVARSKPIYAWRGLPVGIQPPVGLKFESPLKVITCVRRKVRREVIFALDKFKKTRGRGGAKKYRRNWKSDVVC